MNILFYSALAYTVVSAIGLFFMWADKYFAKSQRRRIPEIHLMTLGLFGGAFGILIGMTVFHHKISKPKFCYGIPLIFVIHWILFLYGISRLGSIV